MYFGYQKDSITGRVVPFKSPSPPTDLNGKEIPTIMLVSLTDEEKNMTIDELVKKFTWNGV